MPNDQKKDESAPAAAAPAFPNRRWERQGCYSPPPFTKMLTWGTVDPDNRLELERFHFEMYCEEMCDVTGDPEEDRPVDEMEAACLHIRADNDAYFAQQQAGSQS